MMTAINSLVLIECQHFNLSLVASACAMPFITDEMIPDIASIHVVRPDIPQALRIRNRRKRYLEVHPDYFGPSLESAGMYFRA